MSNADVNSIHEMFPDVDTLVIKELLHELPTVDQVIDRLCSGDYQTFKSKSKPQPHNTNNHESYDRPKEQKYGYKNYQRTNNYPKRIPEQRESYQQRRQRFMQQGTVEDFTEKKQIPEKIVPVAPAAAPIPIPQPVQQPPEVKSPPGFESVISKKEEKIKKEEKVEPFVEQPKKEPVPQTPLNQQEKNYEHVEEEDFVEEEEEEEEQQKQMFNPPHISQQPNVFQQQPQIQQPQFAPQSVYQPQQQQPAPVQQKQAPLFNPQKINQQQFMPQAQPVLMLPQDIAATQPNLYMFGKFAPAPQIFSMYQQFQAAYGQQGPPGF